MAIIGIDLGTTNSLVAYWRDGKAHLIPDSDGKILFPSVVSFLGEEEMLVGSAAREQLLRNPGKTAASFKRYMGTGKTYQMGNKCYKPLELSACVLAKLRKNAENFLQEKIEEAIITVPAYFNDKQRSDTKKAAQIAGLHVERLINEPSAAAIAYQQISGEEDKNLVVFDFGGGTLDLSYVECFDNIIEIVAVAGDNMLGGDDIDACIYDYICKEKNIEDVEFSPEKKTALKKEIEEKKCLLETEEIVKIGDIPLTNEQLFEICIPIFMKIKKLFLRLLDDAEVRISEVDDIIMVGGSSKLKIVRQFLAELLGKTPIVLGETDLIVALGAGAYAGIRQRSDDIKNLIMTDVCPFTLGVETFNNKEDENGRICVLIGRNSTLPCRIKKRLFTLYEFQEKICVKIYQGEEYYAEDNLYLGEVNIKVPRKPAGFEWADVEFSYDINGILQVEVTNSQNEKKRIQLANQELSEEELAKYQSEMENIIRLKSPWENEEYLHLFETLNHFYEESTGARRERLSAILDSFIYHMNKGSMKKIKEAATQIKNIVADLEKYESEKEYFLFDGNEFLDEE